MSTEQVRSDEPDRWGNTDQLLGTALLGIGTAGFLAAALMNRPTSGGLAAAAVFATTIGLCIRCPTLLQDGTLTEDKRPNYSSMRVLVLLLVVTFAMLTLKIGWSAPNLEILKIDESWQLILLTALGGKVGQSIAENLSSQKKK